MKKTFCFMITYFVLASGLYGESFAIADLTSEQTARVEEANQLVAEVDTRSLKQVIRSLEQSEEPEISLVVLEAQALTYSEIVKERQIAELKTKKWLYSMIGLNMALLQFGGSGGGGGRDAALNKLIQKKLRAHLPAELLEDPRFVQSLENQGPEQ